MKNDRTIAAHVDVPLRVGIALGAGSAAAMAQIGVLEVLAEAGIPVHCVAGTSAGAMVGAALAADRLGEFRAALEGLSRRRVLRLLDVAWPREGLLHGLRALEFVRPHLGDAIEDLAIPYAAVATDLRSGDEVALTRGGVFDAVRASIAIPGIFTPWRVGGRLLVDGGLVNPVPVSTARALGAEFVIAVNVLPLRNGQRSARVVHEHLEQLHASEGPDAGPSDGVAIQDKLGLVEIVWQASRILAAQIASARLRDDPAGFLLQIPVPEVGVFEFHRTAELVDVGRRSAEQVLPALHAALARAVPLRRRLARWQRRAASLLSLS
jgi:NTE family protein